MLRHRDRREMMNRSPCPRTRLKLPGGSFTCFMLRQKAPAAVRLPGRARWSASRSLRVAAATRCTPLLASEHARAITTGQPHLITL